MKLRLYPHAVIAACSLGILSLIIGSGLITVSIDTNNESSQNFKSEKDYAVVVSPDNTSGNIVNLPPSASEKVKSQTTEAANLITYTHLGTSKIPLSGSLRMSNQTDQPVRLALLARRIPNKTSHQEYNIPAHWDFAPKEGGDQGLTLSLPEGNLKLQKGDILVAFAQDGSRRYWGPYVVGETPLPLWDSKKQEWSLVLTQS